MTSKERLNKVIALSSYTSKDYEKLLNNLEILDVIINKKVDVCGVAIHETVDDYNYYCILEKSQKLTPKEFNAIKERLENENIF